MKTQAQCSLIGECGGRRRSKTINQSIGDTKVRVGGSMIDKPISKVFKVVAFDRIEKNDSRIQFKRHDKKWQ